jgi:hypothetical protein
MSDDSLNLDKIYKGNGYTLKYADNWQTATLPPNDINVLKFSSSKSYIAEIDHSSYEDTIKCDFTDESCQNDVYNDFYEYWAEPDRKGNKMRFELEKTWRLSSRLSRWQRRGNNGKSC